MNNKMNPTNKNVIIVVRNNALYENYLKELMSFFPENVSIALCSFEKGTNMGFPYGKNVETVIDSFKKINLKKGDMLYCDNSCYEVAKRALVETRLKEEVEIDFIYFDFLSEYFLGKENYFNEYFYNILKKPKTVCLVEKYCFDHLNENFRSIWKDALKRDSDERSEYAAPKLQEIFKGIYPDSSIVIEKTISDAMAKYGEDEDALIIGDSHDEEFVRLEKCDNIPKLAFISVSYGIGHALRRGSYPKKIVNQDDFFREFGSKWKNE